MINYAGFNDKDLEISKELEDAGIIVEKLPEIMRNQVGEVATIIIGSLHGWSFQRAWRYWICKGPGIEVKEAEKLHKEFGNEVRVAGHCGCPSPLEWFKGLACGLYHVDTQSGLKALADTIKHIVTENTKR